MAKETQDIYNQSEELDFNCERFSTGCTPLDLIIGGGLPENKVTCIWGPFSSNKTGILIEGAANFYRKYGDKSRIIFVDAEGAFARHYAETLGLPRHAYILISTGDTSEGEADYVIDTIEGLDEDLRKRFEDHEEGVKTLYILDSLDALSSNKDIAEGIDGGGYNMVKQKQISKFFSQNIRKMKAHDFTFMYVCQARDNIGGGLYADKNKKSGGRAHEFYQELSIYVQRSSKITKKVEISPKSTVERVIGIDVRAKVDKSKVCPPYRECRFKLYFNYGIEDFLSCYEFLKDVKQTDAIPGFEGKSQAGITRAINQVMAGSDEEYLTKLEEIRETTKRVYGIIEENFRETRRKYT